MLFKTVSDPLRSIKELWAYLLAHNLIRLLMVQAALAGGRVPRELSFKHCLQLWLAWQARFQSLWCLKQLDELFRLMNQRTVGNRNGRIEPRVIKRRPKPYKLMVQPRAIARADVAANGHPRKVK